MWSDPEVFGGFLLVRRLADSAMASVSLAVRLGDSSGKPIVVKRPPLGERASGRAAQAILREAEVLEAVRGAGIPLLEAAGDIAGLPYVAVERLRGATLAKVIALGERLPASAVRAIGRDIGHALDRLHAAGWVHRDVAPSNLFIDEAGEAYLLDYGLCERAGDERGAPVAGTRGYAAPEAPTSRAAHPAQDVYGLAVCLAEAALGRRLFDEASLVEAAGRGDAPPQAAALEASIPGLTAALRRDPSARPAAAAFAAELSDAPRAPGEPSGSSVLASLAERAQSAESGSASQRPSGAEVTRAAPDGSSAATRTPHPTGNVPPGARNTPLEMSAFPAAMRALPTAGVAPAAEVAPPATANLPPVAHPPATANLPPVAHPLATANLPPVAHPLAARVPEPVPFGPPRVVTPTVSMPAVVVREVPARSADVVDTVRDLAADARPGVVHRPPGRLHAWQAAALAAVVALAIGFVSGRFSLRAGRGGASFAIAGPLPKRSEVFLDTKKLTFADGVPMPVPAGSHTITIATPKNPKREIPFTVRAGEHVVIVSPLKPGAPPEEDATP